MPLLSDPITVVHENNYWAMWNGERVIFGGEWDGIPDLVMDRLPTEAEIYDWTACLCAA